MPSFIWEESVVINGVTITTPEPNFTVNVWKATGRPASDPKYGLPPYNERLKQPVNITVSASNGVRGLDKVSIILVYPDGGVFVAGELRRTSARGVTPETWALSQRIFSESINGVPSHPLGDYHIKELRVIDNVRQEKTMNTSALESAGFNHKFTIVSTPL